MKKLTEYEKLRISNKKLGSLAKKKQRAVKKPTPLAKIMREIKYQAMGERFIITENGHVFKNGKLTRIISKRKFYYKAFTNYCLKLFITTNESKGLVQLMRNYDWSYLLRDVVMEQIDPKFNRNNPTKFRGMDCIN